MGKRLCRFSSGTYVHGLALTPTSALIVYGDASVNTGVRYTGLVGQTNGTPVVWRSMRESLDAFSTMETEAQGARCQKGFRLSCPRWVCPWCASAELRQQRCHCSCTRYGMFENIPVLAQQLL